VKEIDYERRATYLQALELYGDSVRLLREACRGESAPIVTASLARVEREGLLTKDLLQSLLDSGPIKEEIESVVRDRMQQPLAIAPPAVGTVWNPYVLTVDPGGDGVPTFEVAIPILLTCVFESSGTPSSGTWRTAVWDNGLKRVTKIVDKDLASILEGVEPRWAEGNYQFDLDADRIGGGVCEEDRSYELAAVVAALSATFGTALPPGTAALGLISDEIEPSTRSSRVESLSRDIFELKLRGLVWSLPILHTVFVPKRDEGYAAALLGKLAVKVVGVRSVLDIYDALRPEATAFRGRRREPFWMRVILGTYRQMEMQPGGILEKILFSERDTKRLAFGAICGAVHALLLTNASVSFLAVEYINSRRAAESIPFLIVGSEMPFIASRVLFSAGKGITVVRARMLTEIGPIALCVCLCFEWRSQMLGHASGASFIRLGLSIYALHWIGARFVDRFMPGGRAYGRAYLWAWLCVTFLLGCAGILSYQFLWFIQWPLFGFSIVVTALLTRTRWRAHEVHLVGDIRLIAGVSLRFAWLLALISPLALYPLFLRQHLMQRPLSPMGSERVLFFMLITQALLCAYWAMKTTTLFLGGSLYSDEERQWLGSGEIQNIKPAYARGEEFDFSLPETPALTKNTLSLEEQKPASDNPTSHRRKRRRK